MRKLQKGPELYALIAQMHAEGKTAAETAKTLGLCMNTLYIHSKLLGLPRFKIAPRKITSHAALRLLHWEGKTAAETAKTLGVSIHTINHHRKLLGLPIFTRPFSAHVRHNRWTEADDAVLVQCIADGVRKTDTARRLGRTMDAIQWRRRRLGLPAFKHRPPAPPRTWLPPRIERLAELRAKRVSYRLIAKQLGTTKNSVAGAVRDYLKVNA